MKKIIIIIIVGIIFIGGLKSVAGLNVETNQGIQQSNQNIQKLKNEKFTIDAKYSYIRSYPEGGGIYIIYINPKNDFLGYVSLQINSDPNLNAELDRVILDKKSQVAELTINPNKLIESGTYEIVLAATYFKNSNHEKIFNWINIIRSNGLFNLIDYILDFFNIDSVVELLFNTKTLVLEVEIINWSSANLPEAIIKRDLLIDWLETEKPEFGQLSEKECYAYVTYPSHLVVEHWTFLYEQWEMRICYHVMLPPYDWSMIWLRERGVIDAIFAGKRESDGTAYEIPISDYPTFYGY
jgi:hypothetical protein